MLGLAGPSFVASHLFFPFQCPVFHGNAGSFGGFDSERHTLADSTIGIDDGRFGNGAPCQSGLDSLLPFAYDPIAQDSGLRIEQVRAIGASPRMRLSLTAARAYLRFRARWKNATMHQDELPS